MPLISVLLPHRTAVISKGLFYGLLFSFFTFSFIPLQAQYKLSVHFCNDEKTIPGTEKILSYKKDFRDSLSRSKELQKIIDDFRSEGFLSAGIDSLQTDSLKLTVCIRP